MGEESPKRECLCTQGELSKERCDNLVVMGLCKKVKCEHHPKYKGEKLRVNNQGGLW